MSKSSMNSGSNLRRMYLALDTSQKDVVHIMLFDEEQLQEKTISAGNREITMVLADVLEQEKIAPADIAGIMIVVGTGSFTGTRLAAVVGNTIAMAWQIPVMAITAMDVPHVQSLISDIKKVPVGQYVSPAYSAPARITQGSSVWARS